MREIKIVRLELENFKCHRHLRLDFGGRDVTIYGDNATGKTSIYDALTWLLFGKDSAGNGEKNIEIKPLDSVGAVVDHQAITSVEAELVAGGETVTLKRTYREVWGTKRGCSEATYEGNTSDYFVDGVPCKKYAFDERIKVLVPEDVFRLLTSVEYFAATLPWQKRRAVLFDMAGTRTDQEIMAENSTFTPLLDGMGKLSLEDYRKKLTAEKKGFVGVRDETPARISECQKTISDLQDLDFVVAKAKVAAMEEQQRAISAQIVALEHNAAADAKRMEIREQRLALDKLNMENDAYRAQQTAQGPNADALRHQIDMEKGRLYSLKTLLEHKKGEAAAYDRAVEGLREEWIRINAESFTGGMCPTCGQDLPFEQLQKAVAGFEAQKQRRLQEITHSAEQQKQAQAGVEQYIRDHEREVQDREAHIAQLEREYETAVAAVIVPVDMPSYSETAVSIRESIAQLESELQQLMSGTEQARGQLSAQLADVNLRLRSARDVAAKESVLQYARQRIVDLREEARNAATALEAIEKMLYLAEEYTRHKARFVENGINSLFALARFRLFREQANGGLEERCDVVLDGVPYIGLNNGAKINVGIDIINTLSRHYGVTVPLFVDNAESVTHLQACGAQVIRLVVSENDKELRTV